MQEIHMCKWLASIPLALPIAGILAAASVQAVILSVVGMLAAASAQADQTRAPQSHYGVSSTPSGAGQERPLL
jgi:hypothetical protein